MKVRPILAAHRRALCRQRRCPHSPDFDDAEASCPGGCWGPAISNTVILSEVEGSPVSVLASEPPLPSMLHRAANLAAAVARDLAAGSPRRPPEEVARILALCRACPLFRPSDETCSHPSCGCSLARKAAWAQERCPLGHW